MTHFSYLVARCGLSDAEAAALLKLSAEEFDARLCGERSPSPRELNVLKGLSIGGPENGRGGTSQYSLWIGPVRVDGTSAPKPESPKARTKPSRAAGGPMSERFSPNSPALLRTQETSAAVGDVPVGPEPDLTATAALVDAAAFIESERELLELEEQNQSLEKKYRDHLLTERALTRGLVSFQANKSRSVYRWYKYKEAFSASLVEYLLEKYDIRAGYILDPFAGSGTALFSATARGLHADGIELLPIGQHIIATRQMIDAGLQPVDLGRLALWVTDKPWLTAPETESFVELRITKGAYPAETARAMRRFLTALQKENDVVKSILFFALLCVLESISFTRKDGQYLRWDHRSKRRQGAKAFDKGTITSFNDAITSKLLDIISDTRRQYTPDFFGRARSVGSLRLFKGSCLSVLQEMSAGTYECVLTSPPYCNRYDYTRTYALELALLGVGEERLSNLRQDMLSCTVENRAKDLLRLNRRWAPAIAAADRQANLQTILAYLGKEKDLGRLNNNGIPRMVRGYFYEMACVILECGRVLRPGGTMFMVNDNVRYAGAVVPVDLILADIAGSLGFEVLKILVLPKGKGNSSQQMGAHGREVMRKCVYVWRKVE